MGPAVLVVGDVMLDVHSDGVVERVCPEAPVPVVKQQTQTDSLGGAGNTACNIVALGCRALLLGVVGNDAAGTRIKELASKSGVIACFGSWEHPTLQKHRVTANGVTQLLRIDVERKPSLEINSSVISVLYQIPSEEWQNIKCIVISDYAKGTLTAPLVQALQQASQMFRIPIFVDTKPTHLAWYLKGMALLKPNLAEAIEMTGPVVHPGLAASGTAVTQATTCCHLLRQQLSDTLIVVTAGEHGCAFTDPEQNHEVQHIPAVLPPNTGVRDICGAGDTTMAALAVAAAEQQTLANGVRFAMTAAAVAVSSRGVAIVPRHAVDDLQRSYAGWDGKIVTLPVLLAYLSRYRAKHPTAAIVLANGCFDGLHAGHIEMLLFAKAAGSLLIVAYNDDASLQQLKGSQRPHVNTVSRAKHLAMQECVDFVVSFNGDTAKLISMLHPDILVKGADTLEATPGADIVASRGGKVLAAPVFPSEGRKLSSTGLLTVVTP